MAQESATPVKTFSIGFEEQDFSELKYARRVAEHVGAEYNEFIVRPDALEVLPTLVEHYGEPFADSSAIPTYYVSRETRKHVTVALNGDGGDESFAGYERYMAMAVAEVYKKIPRALRTPLIEGPINLLPISEIKKTMVRDVQRFFISVGEDIPDRYGRWMSTFKPAVKNDIYTDEFANSIDRNRSWQVLYKWMGDPNGTGLLDKMLLTDLMTYLPNDLLVKVDIASMANSLEARSPFLDHKVIEFAASLPGELKMSRYRPKSLLKKVAARLVPRDVVYRPKMGFGVPVGRWFRGEMKGFVSDILLSQTALNRGLIKPEKIREYVTQHTSGQVDHSFQIWTLLMLELWYRRFID
jgi:asparagine synthase (glutamine-hydrolysing)